MKLLLIAPNGVMLPLRLVTAVKHLHSESPVNFTHQKIDDFAEWVGERLRILLQKLRDCKRVAAIRERCERKVHIGEVD